MKKWIRPLVLPVMGMLVLAACNNDKRVIKDLHKSDNQSIAAPTTPDENGKPIPGQYIVVFNENIDLSQVTAPRYAERAVQMRQAVSGFIRDKGMSDRAVPHAYNSMIKGFTAKFSPGEVARLEEDPRVAYVEQDRIMATGKPPWAGGGGGGGGSNGQETPWGITRVNGGVTYSGSNVAWILDSGIDLDHPDLDVDASRGFNAFTKGKDGRDLDDGNGHGTHVAGTIAAIDNNEGVIGVAAGATVIPVKVLNSQGSGSYSGVIAGIDFVGANGSNGDVANMSLGGPASQALDDAVIAASNNGIKFCLAAGNDADNSNNYSPARANGTNIYTISAMNSNDDWAYFSNYANPPVDYCAPGVSVKSCWKGGGYNTISGTSMATPHAAGVLLLGSAHTSGTVNGDPDENADPIITH